MKKPQRPKRKVSQDSKQTARDIRQNMREAFITYGSVFAEEIGMRSDSPSTDRRRTTIPREMARMGALHSD